MSMKANENPEKDEILQQNAAAETQQTAEGTAPVGTAAEQSQPEPKTEKAKKEKTFGKNVKASFRTRSFRVGGYSVAAAIFVIAIAVVLNIIAGKIPAKYTQLDTSSQQLFTISEQTEKLAAGLDEEVDIYLIARSGSEDTTLQLLLEKYEGLSKQIKVETIDPDVYPGFATEYTDSYNENSVIVVCGDRSRYVDYYDIYETDYSNYYTDGTTSTNFAGESEITSAIDYVTREDLPKIYTLTGHGESSLSSDFQSAVQGENIELESLSLLETGEVPEDADAVMIYGLQSDLSEQEKDVLIDYLNNGGKLIAAVDPPQTESYDNLYAVLEAYGVTPAEGIVIEGDQNYYAWSTPYYLLPDIGSHTVTEPLSDGGYYVVLAIAQGLDISDELPDNVSVTSLLTTSDSAFSKIAGYSLDTYEKEDGDLDGPFSLAVAISDEDTGANIVWVGSASLLDDSLNEMVSGGNQDLFLNSLNWLCGEDDTGSGISIHAKSMDSEYLTMSSGTASLLTILVVGLIPLAYLCIGIRVWYRRKRR